MKNLLFFLLFITTIVAIIWRYSDYESTKLILSFTKPKKAFFLTKVEAISDKIFKFLVISYCCLSVIEIFI